MQQGLIELMDFEVNKPRERIRAVAGVMDIHNNFNIVDKAGTSINANVIPSGQIYSVQFSVPANSEFSILVDKDKGVRGDNFYYEGTATTKEPKLGISKE